MQCHRAGAGHVDRLVELHRQAMDVGAITWGAGALLLAACACAEFGS